MKVARHVYEKLIADDLARLEKEMPNSLERRHIRLILERSADHEYDPTIAARDRLRTLLGADQAWPVQNVLTKLADAADLLLHRHDYDGHGYELIVEAVRRARAYVAAFEKQG